MYTEYTPKEGMTIKKALSEAIKIAKESQKDVVVRIEDIGVVVTPNTDIHDAIVDHNTKLELRFEFQQRYLGHQKQH